MGSIDLVTRRRIVLAALMLAALALTTAYSREPDSGPLHAAQRGAGAVAAPLEAATQRVARPFRDAWSWGTGLSSAKSERDALAHENAMLRRQVAALEQNQQDAAELRAELHFVHSAGFGDLAQSWTTVGADVIGRRPDIDNSRVVIDAGSGDGVRRFDPVVTGEGWLVGQVTDVTPATAEVTLISNYSLRVGASVPTRNAAGVISPSVGNREILILGFVRKTRVLQKGDIVTTSGWKDPEAQVESHFPRGLPIGVVSSVTVTDTSLYKQIQVTPYADLGSFFAVQVLVRRDGREP